MSSKPKFPTCIICGRPGIPIGTISQRDVAVCTACAPILYESVGALVSAMAGPRAKAAPRKKVTPEELKQLLAKTVESKGSASIYEYGRRYGFSRPDARRIAQELAAEKGWRLEEAGEKLYLRKPEQAIA